MNDLMNDPDLQVDAILDQEDIINEFKQANPKLLD